MLHKYYTLIIVKTCTLRLKAHDAAQTLQAQYCEDMYTEIEGTWCCTDTTSSLLWRHVHWDWRHMMLHRHYKLIIVKTCTLRLKAHDAAQILQAHYCEDMYTEIEGTWCCTDTTSSLLWRHVHWDWRHMMLHRYYKLIIVKTCTLRLKAHDAAQTLQAHYCEDMYTEIEGTWCCTDTTSSLLWRHVHWDWRHMMLHRYYKLSIVKTCTLRLKAHDAAQILQAQYCEDMYTEIEGTWCCTDTTSSVLWTEPKGHSLLAGTWRMTICLTFEITILGLHSCALMDYKRLYRIYLCVEESNINPPDKAT